MKLTNQQTMNSKSGMTLLELTVVILVLLSLISVLFIGARAWKAGADRAACILNIRSVQNGMRSYANLNNLNVGDTVASTDIIGTGKFVEKDPKCPAGGVYSAIATKIPEIGVLAMTCGKAAAADGGHQPSEYAAW